MEPHKRRNNPYTQIAALHNRGIDYVFRKLKDKHNYSEEISFETILEIASEYIAKVQNEKSEEKKAISYSVIAEMFNMDRGRYIDSMLELKKVPKGVIRYLEEIRGLNEDFQSDELIRNISNIEAQLLNSEYSNEDIKYVLLYIAIAKGSIKDWTQNYNLRFNVPEKQSGWPWKEDAESALQGAFVESTITGGVFSIVSVVGGSVVGSTWAAIKKKKNGQ